MKARNSQTPPRRLLDDSIRVPLTSTEKRTLEREAVKRGFSGTATLARIFIRQGLACVQG